MANLPNAQPYANGGAMHSSERSTGSHGSDHPSGSMGSRQSSEPSGSPAGRAARAGAANSRLLNLAAAAEQGAPRSSTPSSIERPRQAAVAVRSVVAVCGRTQTDACLTCYMKLSVWQRMPPAMQTTFPAGVHGRAFMAFACIVWRGICLHPALCLSERAEKLGSRRSSIGIVVCDQGGPLCRPAGKRGVH